MGYLLLSEYYTQYTCSPQGKYFHTKNQYNYYTIKITKTINSYMDKVVVYPGRFQPMLKHHAEVYQRLVKQYPDAEVYIGTSDKVEPGKSPFNFAEKRKIAQAHGIDPSRV